MDFKRIIVNRIIKNWTSIFENWTQIGRKLDAYRNWCHFAKY
jgi:hypothetical protein